VPAPDPAGSSIRPCRRALTLGLLALTLALALAACGGGGGDDPASADLSPEAAEGLELAKSNGCMTCHSVDGRKSVGPTWQGLYGSEVVLSDGTTVTADDAYLTHAIEDPGDQIVEGFTGVMPERDLSSDEVAKIVAYLRTLGGTDAPE
jgi:cytochrome c oxidase subunit II